MEIKKSKQNPEDLMEALRNKPPQVRSINEIVNLLHVISTEHRSCSILRSCVDKVLMNSSNIRSLRDIIERLRSVSRTNGLRVEISSTSSPETRCHLISDMFSVEIVLGTSLTPDQCPTVTDVRIQHYRGEPKSCPRLVNILRAGKFLEMSEHLKGLAEMYLTFVNPQMGTRAYMALQSLETDLVKMSQVFRETNKTESILDVVLQGTVGLLTPRVAGYRSHLAYYVSPYDLIDITSRHKLTLIDEVPKNIGLHAEVGIEQRNAACSLPISPLIFNKHSIDNSGVARFVEVSQHNSTMVHACFVLHLKPAIPVLFQVAEKIRKDTNLPVVSDETQMSYLEMLHANKDTFKIKMENQSYVYHLNVSEMTGTLVEKVYFSHPGHVMKILNHLRKQAHLNTLLSSCVRKNSSSNGIAEERQWYFDISCYHELEQVNIIFEHPLCKSTASLEIQVDESGFSRCKIYTGRGDPPLCTDQFVMKILKQCSSLPIVMKKLINQSIKHPRKESDVSRIRPLFSATTHPVPNRTPNILTPVHKTPIVQRRPSTSSTSDLFTTSSTPSFSTMSMTGNSFDSSGDTGKKIARNPMLTKLLIPSAESSVCQPDSAVQTKNHPMLMGLLKETENEISNLPHGGNTQTRNSKNPHLSFQLPNAQASNEINYNHGSGNMLVSPGSNFSMMDSQIPIPASHQMPPPSYPTHLSQNQFGSASSLSSLPSPASVSQQYPLFQSSFSSPSPLSTLDDIAGQMNMLSPGLISPGLQSQPHSASSQPRGRRGSRQKSRSIESHQSMDFGQNFEVTTPTFDTQLSVESDSSIAELQNRAGLPGSASLHRSDSMSPVISGLGHMPLQHSTSLKMMSESSNNILVTRSVSTGSGKGMRSMTSPKTTPSLPDFMPGNRSINRSLDSQADFSIGHSDFRSPTSLTPSEIDMDPFTFDDNKNPSKISMSENAISMSRSSKTSAYQAGSMPSNPQASYNDSETLRELAMSKPVLLQALTGCTSPISTKSEVPLFQRNFPSTSSSIMTSLTSTILPANTSSMFNISNKTAQTTSAVDKSLVRQNAIDKQVNMGMQGKQGEAKNEKTVKRRNSSKGEDGKAAPKKRGRPPSIKDHGGKRKKNESSALLLSSSQEEPTTNTPTGITLTVQLSSTGTPISSTTKTKTLNGSTAQQQKPPASNSGSIQTINLNNPNGSTVPNATGLPEELQIYFRSQEELQSRRKREIKERDKKGPAGSNSTSNKTTSTLKQTSSQTAGSGPTASVISEKPTGNAGTVKPGSTSPRPSGGNIQKQVRPRKSSIKDAIEKLYCRMPGTVTTSSITSTSSTTANTVGKDANSNLLPKGKAPPSTVTHLKSTNISNLTKTASKISSDDKPAMKAALVTKPINYSKNSLTTKYPADLTTAGKGGNTSGGGGSSGTVISSDFPTSLQQLVRKDSMNEVLKKIHEAAAASTKQGTAVVAKMPANKMQRTLPMQPAKARSVTPTSAATNAQQRKSPSSQIISQAKAISLEVTSTARNLLFKSSSSTPPPVKKSPSRSSGMLPSRPSSASSVEAPTSAPLHKAVSSSPVSGLFGSNRKPGQGEQQTFVAPSISPTPKRTSPQVSRTASPLTRVEDKSTMPNKSPHRSTTRVTPVPEGSPSSPSDRLVIDDPVLQPSPIAIVPTTSAKDEQCPVFLPGKPSGSQSPERTVMASPLSPPTQKISVAQSMRRGSASRGNMTPSVALTSITTVTSITDSPPIIDDDLMDQAVID